MVDEEADPEVGGCAMPEASGLVLVVADAPLMLRALPEMPGA